MINNLTEYVKSIAVFLLFISFISIIVPESKYKNYINLVMGLILIFIMLTPIFKIIYNGDANINNMVTSMEVEINRAIAEREQNIYEGNKKELIIETYKNNLNNQFKQLVESRGFNVNDVYIEINNSEENFGQILSISAELNLEKNKSSNKSIKIINVERISINNNSKNINTNSQIIEESDEIKNLKSYISGFYNLSLDNIYIKVKDD